MKYIFLNKDNDEIIQAFTTKSMGNMSYVREVNINNVNRRYEEIARDFNIDVNSMVLLSQVHGTDVFVADENYIKGEKVVCDASVTNVPNICLVTIHADCVPVYFYDPNSKSIGLAHSGWKGTLDGISVNVIEKMKSMYGAREEDIQVTIGPCICMDCFEVKDDVYSLFVNKYPEYREYITSSNINLPGIIKRSLIDRAVKEENILYINRCTCQEEDTFFSHRRSTKRNTKGEGAMAALACLKGYV